jgi:hypothetical protein
MTAALLSRLISAGTPADLVAEVAMELGRAAAAREEADALREADEARRSRLRDSNAERQRNWRDRRNGVSHVTDVTGRDEALVTPAAPLDKKAPPDPLKELNPPAPTDEAGASSVPPAGVEPGGSKPKRRKGQRKPGSRLAVGWEPPAVDELPLEIQAIVGKWPDGAYQLTALQFRNHWLAEGRAIGAKRDWMRTWCNWLYRENAQILLLVRRGFDFSAGRAAVAPAAPKAESEAGRRVAALREAEGEAARAIRRRLREDAGERTYNGWIAPAAIEVDGGEVTVISASDFMGSWLEQHFAPAIHAVAGNVLGRPARVFFRLARLDSG